MQRRASCLSLLLLASVLCWPLGARQVRVCTYNILFGVGSVGSTEYDAVKDILQRIDADVVAFQELQSSDKSNWDALAATLGYSHTAFGDLGPFAGGLYLGYFSRYPIQSTFTIESPQNCGPGVTVKELTRAPQRVVIDVPGAELPLVLWSMHHKAGSGSDDRFRRAVEAIRIADDMDDYLSVNTSHVEYVIVGDMNEDVGDSQPAQFNSIPSGVPSSYELGCDIAFPVPYATFPRDAYEIAGSVGMEMLTAFQEDTSNDATRPSSGRRLDYIFVSSNLWTSSLGTPAAEVYNSVQDDGAGTGGLPKSGSPLPAGTSADASDHFAVFADIYMADKVIIPTTIILTAVDAAGAHLEFQSLSDSLYTIEFSGDLLNVNSWNAVSNFIGVAGTGGIMNYVDEGAGTGTPPSDVDLRNYRLREQIP